MNRADFQLLAEERLEDARALLASGRYAGCYYIAGYAVECALKACIARRTQAGDFPPRNAANLYTHNLRELLTHADLVTALQIEQATHPGFGANWLQVTAWGEQARYDTRITALQALQLFEAIDDPSDGVMQWLRTQW